MKIPKNAIKSKDFSYLTVTSGIPIHQSIEYTNAVHFCDIFSDIGHSFRFAQKEAQK